MKRFCILLIALMVSACGRNTAPLPTLSVLASPTLEFTPEPLLPQPAPADQLVVAGYFPDYSELDPDWVRSLTDLIYFSAEPRADGTLDTSRFSNDVLNQLRQLRHEYGFRIHISIGGWERGKDFAAMASTPETRQIFINQLTAYLHTNKLNGADFDWEFPQNDREFQDYISLLSEVHAEFEQMGLTLSVALPAETDFPLGAFSIVDRIHIMSYDRGERHSTFEQAQADVQLFLNTGIPPEKLILGIPFYGREVTPPYNEFPYSQLMHNYAPVPEVDEVNGIFFNGLGTIRNKVCYGMQKGLGGFMVWELSQDTNDESSLLREAYSLAMGERSC